jgi:hypothetical protein
VKLPIAVLSAVLAAACAGCIVEGHSGHVSAGVAVGTVCDHHYVFYPDYGAYCCGSCGFWWVHDGGAWVEYHSRPSHIVVTSPVVVVEERGPSPWVHYDSHMKMAPREHGPPPGRGWRK